MGSFILPAMASGGSCKENHPHVALLPSAGMGHLTPFLRLAATMAARGCTVTLITPHPTVSLAESQHITHFLFTHPHVHRLDFHILPIDEPITANSTNTDPFFLQFEAIQRSAHLLPPLLSSLSPPLSSLVTDIMLASTIAPLATYLCLPNYIFFTSSAKMLSLFAHFPTVVHKGVSDDLDTNFIIPGLAPLPKSWLPPPLFDLTHIFTRLLVSNGRGLIKATGILTNTFQSLEAETLAALNDGKVLSGLPPVLAIGPLEPYEYGQGPWLSWLDAQPAGSVVYVSFGSRTALSKEQIRELGDGLGKSGCRFLWVLKGKKVDQEDDVEIEDLVGHDFLKRVENRGLVVKDWVDQWVILEHVAIGGFVSHCGWNSVTEAAWQGVPVLAWPQHGDQKLNATVVESIGLGSWEESWGWGGEELKGEEIGKQIRELMGNEEMKKKATQVREEARKATGKGGSSERALMEVTKTSRKMAL
ncbi:UDP-glycosyltransferase 708G1-like [Macadamia integrifolia]|uniref:UDP-glycosyltransferase 708G1-like n=1 Tax=Macadamia integrifolia TaxID=60698 RepID=UPI001C4E357D|nr:UDP-glycosyltransferase 708G1-like [Macadamia integrifolia]